MGAIDKLRDSVPNGFMLEKKKELISKSGTIINGNIPEYMRLSKKVVTVFAGDSDEEDEESTVETKSDIRSLDMAKEKSSSGRSGGHGFVFNNKGTEEIIARLTASPNGDLRIYDDLCDKLLFLNEKDSELWVGYDRKRSIMSKSTQAMMKETEIQYRTHGSRLHYLVIGKVVCDYRKTNIKTERMVFPLAMFECEGEKQSIIKNIQVEVEKSGFLNFVLDEEILDGELAKINGGNSIEINGELPSRLIAIQTKIERANFINVENIKVDPTFSMVGVITGFETEYLDPVWGKLL
jgi:hypothetical protein